MATTSNKAAVPITPIKLISHLLIISPTSPPQLKEPLDEGAIKAKVIDAISRPKVTYFRFLVMENTLRLTSRLIPSTKKKVQIRKEAKPKPPLMIRSEA